MQVNKFLYHYRSKNNELEGLNLKDQINGVRKLLNESLMSKNLNFLIGSGCSVPAVALMSITFKKIKEKNSSLNFGKFGGESADLEGYLNWLNIGIKFLQDMPEDTEKNRLLQEYSSAFEIAKKGLLESIPKEHGNYLGEESIVKDNYIRFYNKILSIRGMKNSSPTNIFTTNYDLFNEVALESLAIHYTNGFRGNVNRVFDPTVFQLRIVDDQNRYKEKWSAIRNYIKLYKIHGSIDWYFKGEEIIQNNSTRDEDNVVIYPTINKHMETRQTPYSELFREFSINLQKPNSTLIVIGYGFPDQHINQLISQALSNEDFSLVIFANSEELNVKSFYENHQHKKNMHIVGGTISIQNDGHHFNNIVDYMTGEINE